MIADLVRDLGERFTPEQYLFWSRIEGSLWTLADVVIVLYLLRIVNLARNYLGAPRRVAPYVLLALTLPPAACIPFVQSGRAFFLLEVAVTIPHFGLILWLILQDAAVVLEAIHARASRARLVPASQPASLSSGPDSRGIT